MLGTVGSGFWTKMVARLDHLLHAGGLSGEIRDVRQDIAATLKPVLAVAVEEYDYPNAAGGTSILAATLSTTGVAETYLCNGSAGVKLSPPRNVQVVVAGSGTPTHMAHNVTVVGLDANGRPISETILGTNGGAAAYAGVKCFALVQKVTTSADAGGVDATFSVSNGIVIGLSQTPKLRCGQTVGLCRREIVDGSLLSPITGSLTALATNPPNGAYTPHTAPTTQAPATTSGSVDMTTAGLYGGAGTLDGTALVMNINGVGVVTLDLVGTGNALNETTLLAAIRAAFPGLVVTTAPTTNHLVLTTSLQDQGASIVIAADLTSTANPFLGLTAGTYAGAGHCYAMEYEFDATLQTDNLPGY